MPPLQHLHLGCEVEYEEKDGNFWHLLYPVKETGEMLELGNHPPRDHAG